MRNPSLVMAMLGCPSTSETTCGAYLGWLSAYSCDEGPRQRVFALGSGGASAVAVPDKDPRNYPIADAIALQNTAESPANGCGPCSITCSLRRFHSASKVLTKEMNPASFSNVLLCEV